MTVVHSTSRIVRHFSTEGRSPYDSVEWCSSTATVGDFEQHEVEFPCSWSADSINIVAQKYFRVINGVRETSFRQVIERVVGRIVEWSHLDGTDAEVLADELRWLVLHQRMAFNSPVWFNIGVPDAPQQGSACFILTVEDDMPSILNWYAEEGMIFKGGSGAGVNLSKIRSSIEPLGLGGTASGPLSFMRGADSSAGAIKSGGTTRRAAKMVLLDDHHPDVQQFIWCKAKEERKSKALAAAGFDMSLNGEDSHSVQYQNANNSVRLSDAFMRSVLSGDSWSLRSVTTGTVARVVRARDLLTEIAEAAWECADPGVQFTDTINRWHTLPEHSPINGSNPCSEYLSIDNSACNLASLNLLRFMTDDGKFDVESFEHAAYVTTIAMDAIAGNGDYPTKTIGRNARRYRQLGLGYTNLGALLMTLGVPYDSDDGRQIAAGITSVMTASAYGASADIAKATAPFHDWAKHKESTLRVLDAHRSASIHLRDAAMARNGKAHPMLQKLTAEAVRSWDATLGMAIESGLRNAQATVLAPTGTISFMMGADTTGIEPDFSLVKHKTLVGGGNLVMVNQAIGAALDYLGYSVEDALLITSHVHKTGEIVGAPGFKPEHAAVFATAVGENAIHHMAHVQMLGAVQPFLSGAASKTINLPADATPADIEAVIQAAWSLGVKCLAVYRDGSKGAQPLTTSATEDGSAPVQVPVRHKLPQARAARTRSFTIGAVKGYLTTGEYDDGRLGEVFIKVAKQGSTLANIMDAFAIAVSHGLQYGVPLEAYCRAFINQRFEPAGFTDDAELRTAQSIMDYLFRRLALDYLPADVAERWVTAKAPVLDEVPVETPVAKRPHAAHTGEMCSGCGSMMLRAGSCWACPSCGDTTGCG